MTNPVMRAKLKISSIERYGSAENQSEVLKMSAVAAKEYNPDGMDEDNTYAKFSPSATFAITIANPALLGHFNPGETYYVDFTPVESHI